MKEALIDERLFSPRLLGDPTRAHHALPRLRVKAASRWSATAPGAKPPEIPLGPHGRLDATRDRLEDDYRA